MNSKWGKETLIAPSMCDHTGRLGIPDSFSLFMDVAGEHANLLGIGLTDLAPKGLFWLTAKTMIHFYKRPAMNQTVEISTWPEAPEKIYGDRDYLIEKDGKILAAGKTQWALLNTATGKLQSIAEIYPQGFEFCTEHALERPFTRSREELHEEPFAEYQVRSTDIDIGGHMNNAAYVRAVASCFSTKEWDALKIEEMEVQFRKSCYEGDVLHMIRHDNPGEIEIRAVLSDGTTILQVFLR